MRILHVINSLQVGGAEILLYNSIEKFSELFPSANHHVITLFDEGYYFSKVEKKYPSKNLYVTRWSVIPRIFQLRKYIRQNKIDIVHSHLYEATILCRLAMKSIKQARLISTYHSDMHNPYSIEFSHKRLLLDKFTYNDKYYLLFVSEAIKRDNQEQVGARKNFEVLYNFASDKFIYSYKFNPEKQLKIIAVGNLSFQKNQLLAIRAFSLMKNYNITLDIYGEGSLRQELQNQINLSDAKVQLKGTREITSSLLAQYDLFLMTSKHEGMPISLLEALASGLPSVLNDLEMLRETAQNAAIYFKKDSAEDLKDRLLEIYKNKEILNKLSENAYRVSSDYSSEKYVKRLLEIYQTLLSQKN
jgi:glycosyltransferase involved in cell wall biosynthesis